MTAGITGIETGGLLSPKPSNMCYTLRALGRVSAVDVGTAAATSNVAAISDVAINATTSSVAAVNDVVTDCFNTSCVCV